MRNGWLWAVVGALATLALMTVMLVVGIAAFVSGAGLKDWQDRGIDEFPRFSPVWSYGTGTAEVVRIPVTGEITRNSVADTFFAEENQVERVLREIRAATTDPKIKGIILEIDSPGGDVTAADEIHHALVVFKHRYPHRVVVAIFGDLAASGAYYIACAADYIIAQPTTVTGSIGVLISSLNFRGLSQKLGIEDVTIKSGENKDLLNPLKEMTPEQRALLQDIVDSMQRRFVQLVANGRKMSVAEVEPLADGRIYNASQAQEFKLVDQIGYWDDAVAKISSLLGETSVKVVRYEDAFSFPLLLRGLQTIPRSIERLLRPPQTRLQYRWPGV